MQVINPIRRKLMVRIVLIVMAMGLFLSCNSCSDDGDKVITPDKAKTVSAWAEWSPDGRQIAVCWGGWPTVRGCGVYLIDTAGWVTTELFVDEAALFSSVAWSASGEWLLFAYRAQIYKIKANGDSLTQLTFTSRQWNCDWSDSDSLIVYRISIGDSSGIWLMHSDGSLKEPLVRYGSDPSFALGDSILFIEYTDVPSKRAHLALISIPDSSLRTVHDWVVSQPHNHYDHPRMSKAGDKVVLAIDLNVWSLNIDGTDLTQLTFDGGGSPNWSPTGDRITYFKPAVGGGSLWIMNADGTGKMPVPGW